VLLPLSEPFALLALLPDSIEAQGQSYVFGRADFPVGNHPVLVAAGDFNGVGSTNLGIVNDGDNTISVLLGKADGHLLSRQNSNRTFRCEDRL